MADVVIKDGWIVSPRETRFGSVAVEGGRITKVGSADQMPSADHVVDAAHNYVIPGLVDMHVHLREPGREDKETILTGSRSAAAGGFTSIVCMPNTTPVNDCEAITRLILERAREAGLVNVFPVGAVTKGSQGRELAEIGEMVKSGIVAVTDDGHPLGDFLKDMAGWLATDEIRYREHVTTGLENAVEAFQGLLAGDNTGKALILVSDDPTVQD